MPQYCHRTLARLGEYVRVAVDKEKPYGRGQKRLRFISFPRMRLGGRGEGHAVCGRIGGEDRPNNGSFEFENSSIEGAAPRKLVIPKELDLHEVETINIDQSRMR